MKSLWQPAKSSSKNRFSRKRRKKTQKTSLKKMNRRKNGNHKTPIR